MKALPMDVIRANLAIDASVPSGLRWATVNRGRRTPMAGSQRANGYWYVGLKGYGHFACHRIVWALKHGRDPGTAQIDHRDTDGSNNRASNLRLATPTQNAHNTHALPSSTTGVKGLTVVNGCYWQAQIVLEGTRHRKAFGNIGEPANRAAAIEWLDAMRSAHAGEFARG